jgi:CRP-like cAMP-binding protein
MPAAGQLEEMIGLMPGQVLFEQGDPGGDLYFIQSGEIEIYRTNNLHEIQLASMVAGEIIGIMTCMTNEPRMASARAIQETVVKRVRHENIQKLIGDLPPWMKIVMKDFTNRLGQMNKNYSTSIMEVRELRQNQLTKLHTATQVAAALANLAPLIKVKIDEIEGVFIDDVIDRLEEFLNRPKEEIKDIIDIFTDSGMIKAEKEPERKRTYTTVTNCQSLKNFCTWVGQAKSGNTKKILHTNFSNKEFRVLSSLVRYARKIGLNLKAAVKIELESLEKSMEAAVGQKFEADAIEQAAKVKLIAIIGTGPECKISFVPIELSRTMAHLLAYKKLEQLQEKSEKEGAKRKSAA